MLRPVAIQADHIPLPHLLKGRIAILNEPNALAQALMDELIKINPQVELITTPMMASDVFIFMGGLQSFESLNEALNFNLKMFQYIKHIAPYLEKQSCSFVFVQKIGASYHHSDFSLMDAWSEGIAGLAKTIKLEWPNCTTLVIDLDIQGLNEKQVALTLVEELLNGSNVQEMGISEQKRFSLQTVPEPISSLPSQYIHPESVILVSGGARGITAHCLMELAQHVPATFILLGRTALDVEPSELHTLTDFKSLQTYFTEKAKHEGKTPLPKEIRRDVTRTLAMREVMATIHDLEQKGCRVHYLNLDIRDESALKAAIGEIKARFTHITGIIHAAGVIADKEIKNKTIEEFAQVFDTKVRSLATLLKLTQDEPLRLVILFSSIAARYGNVGQSDYAMANEVLNRVAQALHQRYQKTCLVKSLNWAAWDSGMVTPELKEYFLKKGIPLLPTDEGKKLFAQEVLSDTIDDVEVILGPNEALTPTYSIMVNDSYYPLLKSHQIKQYQVLPIALVIHWMQERLTRVGLYYPLIIEKFHVLRGVKLLPQQGLILDIVLSKKDSGFFMEVKDRENKIYYEAHGFSIANQISLSIENDIHLKPWQWSIEDIYRDKLFHGDSLKVIERLELIGAHMCSAMLIQHANLLQLIDGALQLGILWGWHKIKKPTLPISIEKISLFALALSQENYHVVIKEVASHPEWISFHAYIIGANDQIHVILEGVTMYSFNTEQW